ncbi:MAG: cation transporting ATPase C-terminal domain-containing protein [Desulfitobacterium sp.]
MQATTMTLAAIVFAQIGAVLNCRSDTQSVFKLGLFANKRVLQGIAFEILLIIAIIYIPFLQAIFHTAPIGLSEWLFLMTIPFLMILFDEIRKALHINLKVMR